MEGRERAELKDRITKYVVDKDKGTYMMGGLYEGLQQPTENIDSLITILDEMAAEKPRIFKVVQHGNTDKKMYFKVDPLAKDIPQDKSFVAEYEAMSEVIENEKKAILRGSRIEELTETELEQRIWNNKWLFVIAVVSALAAIGSLVWSIYRDSNNDIKDQLNPKIDSIQIRLERLENGLKQLNRPKVIDSTQTTK